MMFDYPVLSWLSRELLSALHAMGRPNSLVFQRIHFPVGHGGFHAGVVTPYHGEPSVYVYDCGTHLKQRGWTGESLARNLSGFVREFGEVMNGREIDLLAISHFDADHVSGIDDLLAAVPAHAAMLPYLTPAERIYLLFEAALDGNEIDAEFVLDPATWLSARNVQNIYFVTDDPGDDEDSTPISPREFDSTGFRPKRLIRPVEGGGPSTTSFIYHGEPLTHLTNGIRTGWELLPFVHPDHEGRERFRRQLAASLPDIADWLWSPGLEPLDDGVLKTILSARGKLIACYRQVWRSTLNATSMSLYSGPGRRSSRDLCVLCQPDVSVARRLAPVAAKESITVTDRTGWLATGDSLLNAQIRRNAFWKHYEVYLPHIGTLAIPHHGAEGRYFSESLLGRGIPNLLVHAGCETSKHPHPKVVQAFQTRKEKLRVVSQNYAAVVIESGWVPRRSAT